MAVHLNLKSVFCPPLGSEPFGFLTLTDRAIPLLAINPIKGVAVLAVRFLGVQIGYAGAIPDSVISDTQKVEMLRVDAGRVPARVVYNHSIRNLTMKHVPRNTVGASVFPSKIKAAVSVFVQSVRPVVTSFCVLLDFAAKPNVFFRGEVHPFLLMEHKGTWCARRSKYALV